jgi:hypothetical protein
MAPMNHDSRWRAAEPPRVLHDRIRARITGERSTTSRTRKRVIAALVGVPLIAAVVVLIASQRVYHHFAMGLDVDGAHATRLSLTLLALVVMTAGTTLVAVWRGRSGFGIGSLMLAVAVALVVPVYALLTLIRPLHVDDDPILNVVISPWGVRCAVIASVVGLAAIAAFTSALRRAAPVASRLRGAAIGAAAGAWAGLAVFAFCPSGDQQHLIAGHLVPMIVLMAIGALLSPHRVRP